MKEVKEFLDQNYIVELEFMGKVSEDFKLSINFYQRLKFMKIQNEF
jgi:hypothetical protein